MQCIDLYSKMCPHKEDLDDLVNWYFLKHYLINHAWEKDPFEVQVRPMDFNVTEYDELWTCN